MERTKCGNPLGYTALVIRCPKGRIAFKYIHQNIKVDTLVLGSNQVRVLECASVTLFSLNTKIIN